MIDLHSAKAEELLAFLACERGAASKRKAAETLWQGVSGDRAMASLYKTLQHLRGLDFGGAKPVVETRGSLCLDAGSDLSDFIRLCESDGPQDWERAIELYRGVPFADDDYEWAADYEGYYDIRYYELLERLEAHFAALGKTNKARYYHEKAMQAR